tara:strand:- start:638 stop:1300 length:663 start_codon:yes stop_codon:yes gene_type:complete
MSEIFLDIETTGLSFKDNHRIVEIACIETNELIPTNRIFHKIINPERDVPDEAFKIHGFSSDFLKDKPKFKEIADELISFINGNDLIIHNASFDLPFINHELKTLKKDIINKNKIIDTLELARSKYPGMSNSLDALCKRFNVDLSRRIKHNAVLDCELLREVYIYLLDVKEPKLSFNSKVEQKNSYRNILNYSKKIVKPSDEELKNHGNFLKSEFKKNYF